MRVAEGVEALELTMEFMGGPSVIHPTLIWDDHEALLVDAGMPGQLEPLRQACERAGVPLQRLTRVIVTHQDIDHIGGLPALLAGVDGPVEVLAHADDRPYIEGERRPIKMDPARWAARLGELEPQRRAAIEALLADPPRARVDRTLADGERLPYCGGIRVIHTPGHTPGHLSLYLERSRTLIAGDALVSEDGVLQGPRPGVTLDMATALRSVGKLTGLDVERAVTYHGGLVERDVATRLAEIAAGA